MLVGRCRIGERRRGGWKAKGVDSESVDVGDERYWVTLTGR